MREVRIPVIAGNWKMNLGPDKARAFVSAFREQYRARRERSVILFPPALSFSVVHAGLAGRADIGCGVQNLFWEDSGAFTGEISAAMAAEAGADFALVGHSERRHVFGESVEDTCRKAGAALRSGLTPILCVGETLEHRKAGRATEVVLEQLLPVLDTLPTQRLRRFMVAYEPVWAIGTGETASAADAGEMHRLIHERIPARFGREVRIPVLYGGSVKPDNAGSLLSEPGVDGLLVGGASLDPVSFAAICAAHA